jgi:hypothetical protein
MTKLGITGTRSYAGQDYIDKMLDYVVENYCDGHVDYLVSGGARGVDSCGEIWAMKRGIAIKQYLPDYEQFGKSAPMIRDVSIAKECDQLVAFPTLPRGSSHGTEHTIKAAEKLNKKVWIYPV